MNNNCMIELTQSVNGTPIRQVYLAKAHIVSLYPALGEDRTGCHVELSNYDVHHGSMLQVVQSADTVAALMEGDGEMTDAKGSTTAPLSLADSIRVVQQTDIDENGEKIGIGYEIQALNDVGDWVPITEVEVRHEPRMVIVDAPNKPRETK